MVKCQQDHSDCSRGYEVDPLEEKEGRIFLNGDDIEKAVHQFRSVIIVVGFDFYARESKS